MKLVPFTSLFGDLIATWVRCDDDLRWLAPGTLPPLTSEKIVAWKKPGGSAWMGFEGRSKNPVCYGELNPMRLEADHYWIGHVVVDPHLRSCGLGRKFVRLLLAEAFEARGAQKVSLVVFPQNLAAVHCYQSCGFELVGDESHRFTPGGVKERLLRLETRPPELRSGRRTAQQAGAVTGR